jgi:hypothetical protein
VVWRGVVCGEYVSSSEVDEYRRQSIRRINSDAWIQREVRMSTRESPKKKAQSNPKKKRVRIE